MTLPENLLLSGGASGADSIFDEYANNAGHVAYHYVVMSRKGLKGQIFIPSDELYEKAKFLFIKTNAALKRDISKLSNHSLKLLYRNMIIAGKTNTAMYAVTQLDDGKILGGTAWGVQAAVTLNRYSIYVYCQNQSKWFTWDKTKFNMTDSVPKPTGIYSGIGTRNINQTGINAIKELYNVDLL